MEDNRLALFEGKLDDAQMDILCDIADALSMEATADVNKASALMRDGFADAMLNRLKLHHATTMAKVQKLTFEYIFQESNRFAKRNAHLTESGTHPGVDVIVDDERWSLKTEGAQSMREDSITISKFSEAKWIRDHKTKEECNLMLKRRMVEHLSDYDRILVLRARLIDSGKACRYQLVEMPKKMLLAVQNTEAKDFQLSAKGDQLPTSIFVNAPNSRGFTIKLDRSVEKITLSKISISDCTIHATWEVDIMPTIE